MKALPSLSLSLEARSLMMNRCSPLLEPLHPRLPRGGVIPSLRSNFLWGHPGLKVPRVFQVSRGLQVSPALRVPKGFLALRGSAVLLGTMA